MGQFPAGRDRRVEITHMAVHIPLNIGDGTMIEQMGDVVDDIIPYFRAGEIQQKLMAPQSGLPSRLL